MLWNKFTDLADVIVLILVAFFAIIAGGRWLFHG